MLRPPLAFNPKEVFCSVGVRLGWIEFLESSSKLIMARIGAVVQDGVLGEDADKLVLFGKTKVQQPDILIVKYVLYLKDTAKPGSAAGHLFTSYSQWQWQAGTSVQSFENSLVAGQTKRLPA